MTRASIVVILVASAICGKLARADGDQTQTLPPPEEIPQATPVLSVDDTRAHGPTARNFIDLAIEGQSTSATTPDDVIGFGAQVSVQSPNPDNRELRDLLAPSASYAFRARAGLFTSSSKGTQGGPLTFALQRYFPMDMVVLSSLADAHVGVEAALSTPWVSGRHLVPPGTLRIVDGVDTELAQNGWSLRPVSMYVRGDFLACRSFFLDLGAGPEVFVPTTGPTEYDLRLHAASGWSLGCGSCSASCPKVTAEYRARVRMHANDAPVASWNSIGLGVQFDAGPYAVQVLVSTDLGMHVFDPVLFTVRVLHGLSKERP